MYSNYILEVKNLNAGYYWEGGFSKVLSNVTFNVKKNIILGIAGESGSGKSTLASSLYNSLKYPGKIIGGEILLNGINILNTKSNDLRKLRGVKYSFIPQAAMNALNPVKKIKFQFYDVLMAHNINNEKEQDEKIDNILKLVRLNKNILNNYPHELSGGMKQRVVIAMALVLSPDLVILDEPTTGLDVLVEHDILVDIKKIQRNMGITMIFISHDLSILFEITDEMIVMYGGEIVEYGYYNDLLNSPANPYTFLLEKSIPRIGVKIDKDMIIKGSPMNFSNKSNGCYFYDRCMFSDNECSTVHPELKKTNDENHLYRCLRYPEWKKGIKIY